MTESKNEHGDQAVNHEQSPAPSPAKSSETPRDGSNIASSQALRRETRRWWIKLFLQPVLFLSCGAALLAGLGLAQRMGWISTGGSGSAYGKCITGSFSNIWINWCPNICYVHIRNVYPNNKCQSILLLLYK